MGDIKFTPLGIFSKNTFAARSEFTEASNNAPSASFLSGIALSLTGSIGDTYLIVSASSSADSNLGLIVGS